jgi:phosphopentomutase
MKYVGQTPQPFRIRFSEHFRDYKHNNDKSKLAVHLLENKHAVGPIGNIMTVFYRTDKGKLMDTIEKFHIYKITQSNSQINDKNTVKPNIIFERLVRESTNRGHSTKVT